MIPLSTCRSTASLPPPPHYLLPRKTLVPSQILIAPHPINYECSLRHCLHGNSFISYTQRQTRPFLKPGRLETAVKSGVFSK